MDVDRVLGHLGLPVIGGHTLLQAPPHNSGGRGQITAADQAKSRNWCCRVPKACPCSAAQAASHSSRIPPLIASVRGATR
jgi:hypothetical protein